MKFAIIVILFLIFSTAKPVCTGLQAGLTSTGGEVSVANGRVGSNFAPTYANFPYGSDERQVMDVWLAETKEPAPCVVYIHGGGWVGGDKSIINLPGGVRALLDKGISVVSINYRYLPQTIIDSGKAIGKAPAMPRGNYVEAPVKRPLTDAARALQFVRSKAVEWNICAERIAVSGSSAGGCTSLWLSFHDDLADPDSEDPVARQSTRTWCVAVNNAQTTLDPYQMVEWTPNSQYGGHAFGYIWDRSDPTREFRSFLTDRESVEGWIDEYSPYALVTPDDPPVYLYYSGEPPVKGKAQKGPTHTANFGAILAPKLDEQQVDYEFVYPGKKNPRFKNITDFLIYYLKKQDS